MASINVSPEELEDLSGSVLGVRPEGLRCRAPSLARLPYAHYQSNVLARHRYGATDREPPAGALIRG